MSDMKPMKKVEKRNFCFRIDAKLVKEARKKGVDVPDAIRKMLLHTVRTCPLCKTELPGEDDSSDQT